MIYCCEKIEDSQIDNTLIDLVEMLEQLGWQVPLLIYTYQRESSLKGELTKLKGYFNYAIANFPATLLVISYRSHICSTRNTKQSKIIPSENRAWSLIQQKIHFQVETPLYCRGFHPKCSEWRAASMKGVLRAWLETWKSVDQETIDHGFGKETPGSQAGNCLFFDAIPVDCVKLQADVMTPHFQSYYSGDKKKTNKKPSPRKNRRKILSIFQSSASIPFRFPF